MNDLNRYLRTEYRDPEFQRYELSRQSHGSVGGLSLAVALGALCLIVANLLYLRA